MDSAKDGHVISSNATAVVTVVNDDQENFLFNVRRTHPH